MSNYSILRLHGRGLYKVFNAFARLHPDHVDMNFERMHQAFARQRFIHSNGFPRAMNALGNQAMDIFHDIDPMQMKWAWERGLPFDETTWHRDILFHQINHYRPDVVYMVDTDSVEPEVFRNFKTIFPFVKVLAVQRGFLQDPEIFRYADVVFSCMPNLVRLFQEAGARARVLYHSFDETILDDLNTQPDAAPGHDMVFSGTSGNSWGGHENRYALLRELISRGRLEAWLFEPAAPEHAPRQALAGLFPQRVHEPVYGLELFRLLAGSRIVLNTHNDLGANLAGNMRMFEATGVGSCLLTTGGDNLGELYEHGTEVVTYSGLEDCLEKAAYLLEHEDERREIARRGQIKTLERHTILERCREIDAELRLLLRDA